MDIVRSKSPPTVGRIMDLWTRREPEGTGNWRKLGKIDVRALRCFDALRFAQACECYFRVLMCRVDWTCCRNCLSSSQV